MAKSIITSIDQIIQKIVKERNFNFSNTIFKCDFIFNKVISYNNTYSRDINDADFSNCEFEKIADFSHVVFSSRVNFRSAKFFETLDFSGTTFNALAIFCGANFEKNIKFQRTTFTQTLDFSGTTEVKTAFNSDINFQGMLFNFGTEAHEIRFNNCVFLKKSDFSGISFPKGDLFFESAEFHGEPNFSNAQFNGKVRFHNTHFLNSVNFDNTKFEDLIDFYGSHFVEKQVFYKTDFIKTTVFSRCIFEKNVLFTYSLVSGVMIFRHAVFNTGLDLALAIITGDLNFFKIKLGNYSTKIILDNSSDYDEVVEEGEAIPTQNKRETFRIIYDTLIKQNNKIDALVYHKYLIDAYQEEILPRKENSDKVDFKNIHKAPIGDLIINLFNKYSNDYGLSWKRGIIFTLIVAVVFYCISLLFLDSYRYYSFGLGRTPEAIKLFFDFLSPIHKIDFMDRFQPSGWFYFFDFLGRIFISYGIYQVVSAFRKYNKPS